MKSIILLFIVFSFVTNTALASWQEDLTKLIKTENEKTKNDLITKIVSAKPELKEIVNLIKSQNFNKSDNGVFIEKEVMCVDGKKRPYVTYVPNNYDPGIKTPMIINLHGGVHLPMREERVRHAKRQEVTELAIKNNWFIVFPFAEPNAAWWDNVGQSNVLNIIRETKKNYNIDDENLWMTGFSDGASASFHFAMTKPTNFAAFVPLNGDMGVGAIDGGHHLYPANMSNRPLYVINTDRDIIYPAARMIKTIELAREAGADIFYREYHGFGHDFGFADDELPRFERYFKRNSRNSLPHHIAWKSAQDEFSKISWLKINQVTEGAKAAWHKDFNTKLLDERVMIGFDPDFGYEGNGVKVAKVPEGDALSNRLGLKSGDIVIQFNETKISNLDSINNFKATVNRGDFVKTIVLRNGNEVTSGANIPDPQKYDLFPRTLTSGAIVADFVANTFEVKTSRVNGFSIYLHPDMIQLDQDVVIKTEGKELYRSKVTPDIAFMLNNFLENRDRELLYFKKIDIDL
jgi:enterochelin esterase-like enzyme